MNIEFEQNPVSPKMIRPKQAAQYLGVSTTTFWQFVREGKIPQGVKYTPKLTAFKIEDLDQFIENASRINQPLIHKPWLSKRGRPKNV
jgi:excisionase family DNA binding protein